MSLRWFRVMVRALLLDVHVHLMNLSIHLRQADLIHFYLYPCGLRIHIRVWIGRLLNLDSLGGRARTQITLQRLGFLMNWHDKVLGQGVEERWSKSTQRFKPRDVIAHGFPIVGGYRGTETCAERMKLMLEFLSIRTWEVLWLLT
jgi:hypothetical protein